LSAVKVIETKNVDSSTTSLEISNKMKINPRIYTTLYKLNFFKTEKLQELGKLFQVTI